MSFEYENPEKMIEKKRAAEAESLTAVASSADFESFPRKRFFRSRAHCNPLSHNDSFSYPLQPSNFKWENIYSDGKGQSPPSILDLGMGFGGLTVALAVKFPDQRVLGVEIRAKVCEFVRLRIESLRNDHPFPAFRNAACLRSNGMRYMPNYLPKFALEKLFICFPDPHFKAKNHRRRIVSISLLADYAYFIRPGGRLYTITDVEELHRWHCEKGESHRMFRRLNEEELNDDEAVKIMSCETEESKKVDRLGGRKHFAVFERLPEVETEDSKSNRLADLWAN